MAIRQRIYEITEVDDNGNTLSRIYDVIMMCAIGASIVPMAFKEQSVWMSNIDRITVVIFIIDYLLRWLTADIKTGNQKSLLLYPFTPMAIIDLLSILPSLTILNGSFRLLKIFRLLRSCRIFKVFKLIRYSKSVNMILTVFKKQKEAMFTIGSLALAYVLISALVILNVEPDTFSSYFDAVYWATVSLTTVGYGDIYPITTIGRIITMVSSVFGIAIVALPAGIITAGMMEEINKTE